MKKAYSPAPVPVPVLVPIPDYDARWKGIIYALSEQFLKYFFKPSFWKKIDFAKGIHSMDKELQKSFPDWGKDGRLYPDKMLKMFLKNNLLQIVLVHVEVETGSSKEFAQRMFSYFLRLWDKYPGAQITCIVIYMGASVPVKYKTFTYSFAGTKIRFDFNAYIIKDQKEAELIADPNPFSKVVLACLYILKSRKDFDLRLQFKLKLMRLCFECGFSKQEIKELLIFVGFAIALPPKQDGHYTKEVNQIIEKKMKPLVEENPIVVETIEKFVWGKTAKERDKERDEKRNKEIILGMHSVGIFPDVITKVLKLDRTFVDKTIEDYEKAKKAKPVKAAAPKTKAAAQKKKPKTNGAAKKPPTKKSK